MDLHLAPNSTQFFSMCRAKTLAQNRSVFGNAEVNVDVRYSLEADTDVYSKEAISHSQHKSPESTHKKNECLKALVFNWLFYVA